MGVRKTHPHFQTNLSRVLEFVEHTSTDCIFSWERADFNVFAVCVTILCSLAKTCS